MYSGWVLLGRVTTVVGTSGMGMTTVEGLRGDAMRPNHRRQKLRKTLAMSRAKSGLVVLGQPNMTLQWPRKCMLSIKPVMPIEKLIITSSNHTTWS